MPSSPSTKNYTLGKGKLYLNRRDVSTGLLIGERAVGNAPEINFNVDLEALDHFSSTGGLKAKDKKIIASITPKFNFTLDEVNADNLALLLMSDVTDVTQVASTSNAAVSLTGVSPGLYYSLSESLRDIGITILAYDAGTALFTVDEVVSGAAGVGTVVQVVGDAVSGVLYLKDVTPGFINDEALTGDVTGAAVVNGIESLLTTSVSVEDADAAGTFFTAGVDFTVDSDTARIFIVEGGAIDGTAVTNLTVVFSTAAATFKKIAGYAESEIEVELRYVSDNPVGNQMEMRIWRVSLIPTGDTALIGDDWSTIAFDGEVLKDDVNHPAYPYLQMHIMPAA